MKSHVDDMKAATDHMTAEKVSLTASVDPSPKMTPHIRL